MKIIVCVKEIVDSALNLDFGLSNSVIFNAGLPHRLNPPDAAALSLALELKAADSGVEITVVSIGEERVESYLRNAIAAGADKAVRIWDEDLTEISPYQKALILSGFTAVSGADLVLTGWRSADNANGQVGLMLAARLGWPCICNVTEIEPEFSRKSLILVKDIGRGEREKTGCRLPAVVTVKGEGKLPYTGLDELLESKAKQISLMSPAGLGISQETLKNTPAGTTRLTFPRPRTVKAPPLDSSLPAFDRILQLLQGGISKRIGHILEGDAGQIAEQLYQIFLDEGVIKSSSPFHKEG